MKITIEILLIRLDDIYFIKREGRNGYVSFWYHPGSRPHIYVPDKERLTKRLDLIILSGEGYDDSSLRVQVSNLNTYVHKVQV